MGNYSFRGGEHPAEAKDLTRGLPLTEFLPKGELVFPLGQHIGKPASPVVKKGDEVLAGQLIAEASGFVSANIYSSCSGKVKAVERRIIGAGVMAECVVIENDGLYKKAPGVGEKVKVKNLSNADILERIKNAGIVGLGGAGFPTHVKLAPKNPEAINYFIANGAECEPGITCDDRLMRERPEQIVEGMRLVLRLFPNAKGIIAIEANKPEAITAMEQAVMGDEKISVRVLQVKYPQGGERNLCYMASGMYVPSGGLPSDVGCIVDNVATIYSIYRAVAYSEPLTEKFMTVTGDAVERPANLIVKLGTKMSEILEFCGLSEDAKKVIAGGPMMGLAISSLDIPVVKTSNALTCMMVDPVEEAQALMTNCIRCGRCTRVCPLGLMPQQMAKAAERKDYERYVKLHGTDCISCGTCTFTCPAKRPLTQLFAQTKPAALAWKKEQDAQKEVKA